MKLKTVLALVLVVGCGPSPDGLHPSETGGAGGMGGFGGDTSTGGLSGVGPNFGTGGLSASGGIGGKGGSPASSGGAGGGGKGGMGAAGGAGGNAVGGSAGHASGGAAGGSHGGSSGTGGEVGGAGGGGVGGGSEAAGGAPATCDPGAGNVCGCNGEIQCDGTCSNPGPANVGASCGACGGTVQCDSTCSKTEPADLGKPCGTCGGTITCAGTCSKTEPAPATTFTTKTYSIPASNTSHPDINLGGPCGAAYVRSQFFVDVSGTGSYPQRGSCEAFWANNDPTSCAVFIQVTPGTTNTTSCKVTIQEVGTCN